MQTKDIQGTLWSKAPADWVKFLEPTFIPMYQAALKAVPLNEDKLLLDAGCGAGLFLSMAAHTGVELHGIDAAPGLLALAKSRIPEAALLVEDLEALPFIDGTFDVVTGFNSFQYAGNFQHALMEARRVVKRHGKVVIGIWGFEKDCEAASVLSAVAALLPLAPASASGPVAWSDAGKIETMCSAVGLKLLQKQAVSCPWSFSGDEVLQQAFLCMGPCAKAVQAVGEPAVRNAIVDSAQPYNIANDVYYMRNEFTIFITEKI